MNRKGRRGPPNAVHSFLSEIPKIYQATRKTLMAILCSKTCTASENLNCTAYNSLTSAVYFILLAQSHTNRSDSFSLALTRAFSVPSIHLLSAESGSTFAFSVHRLSFVCTPENVYFVIGFIRFICDMPNISAAHKQVIMDEKSFPAVSSIDKLNGGDAKRVV